MTRDRAGVFGEVASLYDARRPGYPDELYDALLAYVPGATRVLEAGAGTGKATVALALRGLSVEAVEPDAAMAAIARERCAALPVRVVEGVPFESWQGEAGAFDLVASAQAWHWVDHLRGVEVAGRALRPGGALAMWWNRIGSREGPVFDAIEDAYRREAPSLADDTHVLNVRTAEIPGREPVAGFAPWEQRTFYWSTTYRAREYGELLETHSDHRLLEPERRSRLIDAVVRAIEDAGDGKLEYRYRTVLQLARRD
jgi:SAM-dependent methyltransferase